MSGTPAFTFEIKRNGRKPQEVIVNQNGQVKSFLFGPDVSKRQITEMLPRLLMDFRSKRRKDVA